VFIIICNRTTSSPGGDTWSIAVSLDFTEIETNSVDDAAKSEYESTAGLKDLRCAKKKSNNDFVMPTIYKKDYLFMRCLLLIIGFLQGFKEESDKNIR